MKFLRFVIPAAITLLATTVAVPNIATAQGYGNSPLMAARTWHEVERAGDTWDGLWTFDDSRHRTISATWVDRQTGARVSAPRMVVRLRGNQVIITRPGTGDYSGTLSADGQSIHGTMSWIQGSFTARVPRQ